MTTAGTPATEGTLMPVFIVTALVIVVLIILVVALIGLYNGIITKRNRCDNAWQQIDAQLQRRGDLIPNLVETVKGYATHEKSTLEEITQARASMQQAKTPGERIAADDVLTGALRQLFAVAESYPDLKANTNFQQLQVQLEEAENKVAYARQSFNDCVLTYNNAIQTFPGNLVASFGNFGPKEGFAADEGNRQVPQVRF